MVSMMGEPILEFLQTTLAEELSSSAESKYPSALAAGSCRGAEIC